MRGETNKDGIGKVEYRFQSTLPMRGETHGLIIAENVRSYFNPLSPCGERPFKIEFGIL